MASKSQTHETTNEKTGNGTNGPTQEQPKKQGILSRVLSGSDIPEQKLKVLIWGSNGTGKSALCGTMPGRVLYAYTEEQGRHSAVSMNPDISLLKITCVEDLRELLKELRTGKTGFDSIALDSFTEMQVHVINEVGTRKERDPNEPMRLSIEERGMIHDRSKNLIRAFRDLDMHVMITCLAETVIVGEGENAKTVTRPMLSGQKLPAQLGQFFNIVGFTYKGSAEGGVAIYRVLLDGRKDIDTKGLPGLRFREEPDVSYWYERAFKGAKPRDEQAPMIAALSRTWASKAAAND